MRRVARRAARRAGQGAVLAVAAACATAGAFAWACLPNLEITQASPGSPPGPVCGDGVIDPDAGETCDPGPDASALALQACVGCQVSCGPEAGTFPFTDPRSDHCYFELDDTSDIDTAGADCEASGGHVVRFVGQNELALVIDNAHTSPFWVGIRELSPPMWSPTESTSEPGWSPGCAGCFAAVDGGAIPVGSDLTGTGPCVVGNIEAPPWTQSFCSPKSSTSKFGRLTLCEREPVGKRSVPCPQGACFTVASTTKHYVLLGSPSGSGAAVEACQALGGEAQLVVFGSPEEREQVGYEIGMQTVIADGGAHDFWVGLGSDAGSWTWDGPDGMAPPWALNEPTDAGSRAYVIVHAGTLSSELALVANPGDAHYPLCQR